MSYLRKVALVTFVFIMLSLGSATVARADTITFTFTVNGTATVLTDMPGPPRVITFTSMATGPVTPFGIVAYSATGRTLVIGDPNPSTSGTITFSFNNGADTFQTNVSEVFDFATLDAATNVEFTQNLTITDGTGI